MRSNVRRSSSVTLWLVAASSIVLLAGCSQGVTASAPRAFPDLPAVAKSPLKLTAADFSWSGAEGADGGIAVATCQAGYRIIGGGSSSANGSPVGTGYAIPGYNAWFVKPQKGTSAFAFASCVRGTVPASTIIWVTGTATNNVASVMCPTGYTLISAYGDTASGNSGTITREFVDTNVHTRYWVYGGANVRASCGATAAGITTVGSWNTTQHQTSVYTACPSNGFAIGGLSGNGAWSGPPIQQHTSVANGSRGYGGWIVFSSDANMVSWVACVPSS